MVRVPGDGAYGPTALEEQKKKDEAAAQGAGESKTPPKIDPLVGIGTTYVSDHIPGRGQVPSNIAAVTTMSQGRKIIYDLYVNNPRGYKTVVAQLRAAGFLGENARSWSSVTGAWDDLLQVGAASLEVDKSPASNVFQILAGLAARSAAGYVGGGGTTGGGGGGTTTYNASNVDLTNPDNAKTLANSALSTYLGRDANPQELKQFLAALNAHERANPKVVSQTTTTAGSSTTQSGTSSGGVSPQQFAEDWARSQEGTAEYAAGTKYMGALLNAIKNPQGVL